MIRVLFTILLIVTQLSGQSKELSELSSNSEVEILYVGDYKKGELDMDLMNKQWWGLYEKDNNCYLKKVEIKLEELEPDVQYDWEYRISVSENKDCIILISGINLSERNINHFTDNDVIRENNDFTFEFGPYHTYLSSTLQNQENSKEVEINNYSVKLNYKTNQQHQVQELFVFPSYDNTLNLSLLWAGDLDNDGTTDFLIQIPSPYNNEIGFSTGLFLSSKASLDEIVKLVAIHNSTGC